MFDIDVSDARRVVLVRFHGQLGEADFSGLDRIGTQTRSEAQYDCIFDMTGVERVDLATEFVVKRGELPQAFKDHQRIYVVPQDDLKLLVKLYAAYQASKGWRPPEIVGSLDEALSRLAIGLSDFRRLPPETVKLPS
jgi:hypothetical protein